MKKFRLYLVISGSGEERDIGLYSFRDTAERKILKMDDLFTKYLEESSRDPADPRLDFPESDPLHWWEGCDVYLEDRQSGVTYAYVEGAGPIADKGYWEQI